MGQGAAQPVVTLRGVSKSFGAVAALRDAHLELYAGEAHALVGENGAGKSTLIKVLAGVHRPDRGSVEMRGEEVELSSPSEAREAGIAVIYQEPTLFPDLTVAENIYIGRQPRGLLGRIDRGAMNRAAKELFDQLAVPLNPDRPARGLSIADQQIVEIAKAISLNADVLVMDEPTAALSGVEVDRLFAVARSLREAGAAILFISHRFEEVEELCQRVTVMRDGAHVSTDLMAEVTIDQIVRQMVGRELEALFPKQEVEPGEVVLAVSGLTRGGVYDDVSLWVRSGEIVALAGLVGAGRSEVARGIFGIDPRDLGTVSVNGVEVPSAHPRAAMSAGIALVPEDRREQGLVLDLSIMRNATLARFRSLAKLGLLTGAAERQEAERWTSRLQTRFGRLTDPVGTLSGGNQQKVVLAKWLSTRPKVLIVDEPTRGIDVGTKAEVHRLLSQLAAEGVAILMISSELPEVLGMADRILVMHEGSVVAEIAREDASEEAVMFAATGQEAIA